MQNRFRRRSWILSELLGCLDLQAGCAVVFRSNVAASRDRRDSVICSEVQINRTGRLCSEFYILAFPVHGWSRWCWRVQCLVEQPQPETV